MQRFSFLRAAPWALLCALSFLFRMPALLNASATNSDAAIVGLQAMHLLRGEWSPFLFGSGYQTTADAMVAGVFFVFLGPTPLALMLSSLVLYVTLTLCVFTTLKRHVEIKLAFLLTLALVFTTSCVHSYALYPPRQCSLTLAMAAITILDSAKNRARFAIGGGLTISAWLADPYAVILIPGILVLALLRIQAEDTDRGRRLFAFTLGSIALAIPLWMLRHHPRAEHGVMTMSLAVIPHNLRLFVDSCFPWMSGTAIFAPAHWMDYVRLTESGALHAFQITGVALACSAVFYAPFAIASRSCPPGLRPLVGLGITTIAVTLVGFMVSKMVMDMFAMRYLAAIVLMLPFAFAPLAVRLGPRYFAIVLAPYLATAAIGGWLGYGPYVDGVKPVVTPSARQTDETELFRVLDSRGINVAIADYWSAYRLSFLAKEHVVFVPLHATQDRIPEHRSRFEIAHKTAYIYDDLRSFENRENAEKWFLANGNYDNQIEKMDIGVFHVVILTRSSVITARP